MTQITPQSKLYDYATSYGAKDTVRKLKAQDIELDFENLIEEIEV